MNQTILVECALRTDPDTGNLVRGATKAIKAILPHFSERTISRYYSSYRAQKKNGIRVPDLTNKREGHCGRKSKLTEEVTGIYREIMQDYVNLGKCLSYRMLKAELDERGIKLALSTVQDHCKQLGTA